MFTDSSCAGLQSDHALVCQGCGLSVLKLGNPRRTRVSCSLCLALDLWSEGGGPACSEQGQGSSVSPALFPPFTPTGFHDPAPLSLSDSVSLAYQRVQKVDCTSLRPVLILGPLLDVVKEMLVNEAPSKFCRCPLGKGPLPCLSLCPCLLSPGAGSHRVSEPS